MFLLLESLTTRQPWRPRGTRGERDIPVTKDNDKEKDNDKDNDNDNDTGPEGHTCNYCWQLTNEIQS